MTSEFVYIRATLLRTSRSSSDVPA